jgi:hypothetical protein
MVRAKAIATTSRLRELPLSLSGQRLVGWIGLAKSKFHDWQTRYGKVNEHNAWVPRDHGLEPEEKKAILDFHDPFPHEGDRRLTFMMLDRHSEVFAVRDRKLSEARDRRTAKRQADREDVSRNSIPTEIGKSISG